MPGSCESEKSSSSLSSSLRKFRFQNKSKQPQQPEVPETAAQSSKNIGPPSQGVDRPLSSVDRPLSTVDRPLSQKPPTPVSAYNPLSYRKYENSTNSIVLLQNISAKIQILFKNYQSTPVLDLKLTTEEVKKLKDSVLQQTSLSVKWSSNVNEYASSDSDDKLLKVKRFYLHELSKYITDVLNNKFAKNNSVQLAPSNSSVRTYSKANRTDKVSPSVPVFNSQPSESQGAMDDYEEFCEKEGCLRKLLDAFPGADIMEAQDILVKCNWDLNKAVVEARNQPLRTSRKRGFPGNSVSPTPVPSNLPNQSAMANTARRPSATESIPEEIVLDSSDEEEMNGSVSLPTNCSPASSNTQNRNMPPAKRARRLISTDSEDEMSAPVSKSPSASTYQNSQLTVSSVPQKAVSSLQHTPVSVQQKVASPVQQTPISVQQKVVSSVQQTPISVQQKVVSSVQQTPISVQQKVVTSVQQTPVSVQQKAVPSQSTPASVQQKSLPSTQTKPVATMPPATVRAQNNSLPLDKTINVPQALSIKPVQSTPPVANSEIKPAASAMPSLPKGLVITQVGNTDNKKPETDGISTNANNSNNIPQNSKKSAHLVRIKPTVGTSAVSCTPVSTSAVVTTANSTMNASSVNKTVSLPMSKGVSITPVGSPSVVPKPSPKTLSITPVGNIVKTDSTKDKSPRTSTEDESPSDGNSSMIKERKKVGRKPKVSDSEDELNKTDEMTTSENNDDKALKKVSKDKKLMHSKRKRIDYEDDDDEEYGNDDIYDSEDSDCEENLTSAHSAVLKFFQESSADELGSIPGCSKKKIEAIINLRPFTKWIDLVEKLKNDKALSTDLLNGAKKVLDMRNSINKLMTKCQRISLDMEDLVENLKENKESSTDYVSKQPSLLNERMHLTGYQMLGLNWLMLMHNQQVNAILADEMGLGKTVQAIAFLAYLKEIEEEGPHLIVVPSSTLDNWKKELELWWPTVSVICYHGHQEGRRELRMQILNDEVEEFDVMITTYNMVTSSAEDRNFFKRLEFNYVVFDEAHMLKNMSSQRYANLMRIKAPRRLLLTGTPLQNNLVELMSLLIFAMPHMFSGKTEQIKQMFSCVSKATGQKNSYEKDRIDHAKRIMKPFVLRRLKRDVLKELPQKQDETRYCPMVEDQAEKYNELIKKFSAEVQVETKEEKDASSSGAGMMMQLRRGANHPLLLRRFYDEDKLLTMSQKMVNEPTHSQSDPNIIFEDMSVMSDFELHKLCMQFKSIRSFALPDSTILNSGKFKVLEELLPDLIKEDHRILLFSQFTMVLDIIQEYMNIKKYKFLRLDGQTPVSERQQLIDEFNNDPEILIFLLSTRAGGLGINLTAADTVILHDIDFNPYNDKQAEDRCHRVGQVRDVRVIRLISENTIEEGILQRAKEKLKLEKDIHDEGDDEEQDTASVAMLLRDALGLKSSSKS